MEPVVVIEDGTGRDADALKWATTYAQLIDTGLEIHGPHDDFRAQLVVVGYRGHSNSPLGLGDHVLPLLAKARCDTVVVRGTPSAVGAEHRRITVLVSGGTDDDHVLQRAADFARRLGTSMRVLHAAPVPPVGTGTEVNHSDVLSRAAATLGGVPHSAVLVRAQPHEAIAHCIDTDLIVVGSGESHENGSVTRAALHHAPCPVLVVHQPVLEEVHGHDAIPAPRRSVRTEA
ncbi:universal stress protein [Lentzea sp. BCCO 10_0061]|uniref:Universal stress protein n=1 Tax=Lentzea sokolovensis TaxID=3095429 RepID=A0ABU4UPT1_9PSEU|nr:universal stress protein [Lentzea sp. BCCO 10_0061]MDX8141429.1 universal stress protein [Lentzea sp. BCCO 10_0061]